MLEGFFSEIYMSKNLSKGIVAIETELRSDAYVQKLNQLLAGNSSNFIASVLHVVSNNKLLESASIESIKNAALTAAALELPIQLGCAYIVPHKNDAQLQIGYRGFYQLAMRTNKFDRLDAFPVYGGMLLSRDKINGFTWNWEYQPEQNEVPSGYFAFLRLKNGFSAELYMTSQDVVNHAYKFSDSFKRNENDGRKNSVWHKNFDEMACKTVLKMLLSKKAPLSIHEQQIQTALEVDQSVITAYDVKSQTAICHYSDNEPDGNIAVNRVEKATNAGYPDDAFRSHFPRWEEAIRKGSKTPEQVIALISTKGKLSSDQIQAIQSIERVI